MGKEKYSYFFWGENIEVSLGRKVVANFKAPKRRIFSGKKYFMEDYCTDKKYVHERRKEELKKRGMFVRTKVFSIGGKPVVYCLYMRVSK